MQDADHSRAFSTVREASALSAMAWPGHAASVAGGDRCDRQRAPVAESITPPVERALPVTLSDVPVLTLFGRRNDRFGWQDRFARLFPNVTAGVIEDGHHFPCMRQRLPRPGAGASRRSCSTTLA